MTPSAITTNDWNKHENELKLDTAIPSSKAPPGGQYRWQKMLQIEWAQHIYSTQDRCWFINLIQTVESVNKINLINQITDAVKMIIYVYASQNKWIHLWCKENVSLNLTSAVFGGFLNNKPTYFDSIFVAFVAFEPERERFQHDWCPCEWKQKRTNPCSTASMLGASLFHAYNHSIYLLWDFTLPPSKYQVLFGCIKCQHKMQK